MNVNININNNIHIIDYKKRIHLEHNWNRDVYSTEEFHVTFTTNNTKIKAILYANEKKDSCTIKELLLIDELERFQSFNLNVYNERIKELERIKQNKAKLAVILWERIGKEITQ